MAKVLSSLVAIYPIVGDTIKSPAIDPIVEALISLPENELITKVHYPVIEDNTTLVELINSSKLNSIARGIK